jgi:hypothetical protein
MFDNNDLNNEIENIKTVYHVREVFNKINHSYNQNIPERNKHVRKLIETAFNKNIDTKDVIPDGSIYYDTNQEGNVYTDAVIDNIDDKEDSKYLPANNPKTESDEEQKKEKQKKDDEKSLSFNEQINAIFNDTLLNFLDTHKRYYFFQNHKDTAEKFIFVYDDCLDESLKLLINKNRNNFGSIQKFSEFTQNLPDISQEKYCVFLMLSSELSEHAKKFCESEIHEKKIYQYNLHKNPYNNIFELKPSNKNYELHNDIQRDNSIFLSNVDINRSEETLIKLFFPACSSLIGYKLLKGGFSGAKVIEVFQNTYDSKPHKQIIKIDKKCTKKIKQEYDNLTKHINFKCDEVFGKTYCEFEDYEAIMYSYASTDSKRSSKPFTKIFTEDLDVVKIGGSLERLFSRGLMENWQNSYSQDNKQTSVNNMYKNFIKDNLLDEIDKMTFDNNKTIKDKIQKVLAIELPFFIQKTSHGDLHTDNIMCDEENVFLIDFGMTGRHHFFIDYATLEMSIRLKSIPRYYPIAELKKYDNTLLQNILFLEHSIPQGNNFLYDIYKIIINIRQKSISHIKSHIKIQNLSITDTDIEINYLISLFCLAYRNLPHDDLNQKYALYLCDKLADKIIELLNSVKAV